jgi:uncharacterized membrane protein YfcA
LFSIYLIIGAIAGLLAGLLGISGGAIVVPALAAAFLHFGVFPANDIMHVAINTSLAAMIVTLLSALRAHTSRAAVRWDIVRLLVPGLIIGAIVGAVIAHNLSSQYLQVFFGVFLIVISLRMLLDKSQESATALPSHRVMQSMAGVIGILASVLGVGGGGMLIPFLLRCGISLREAMGTSVACGLGVSVVATISFMLLGVSSVDLSQSTGYVYWPAFLGITLTSILFAPLGTTLAHKLPTTLLKRIFAAFLLLVAAEMLFK